MKSISKWAGAACLTLLITTVAAAQMRQIPGEQLTRWAPASLAGHALANPMTGTTAGAQRMVQPGAVEAVYALSAGAFANLTIGNTYGSTPHIVESCTTWEPFGAHRACVSATEDRVTLRWAFSRRIMVTLSAPDRATAVRLGRALDLDGLAAFVERTPGTPLGE